jgi:hypothetical protein
MKCSVREVDSYWRGGEDAMKLREEAGFESELAEFQRSNLSTRRKRRWTASTK